MEKCTFNCVPVYKPPTLLHWNEPYTMANNATKTTKLQITAKLQKFTNCILRSLASLPPT